MRWIVLPALSALALVAGCAAHATPPPPATPAALETHIVTPRTAGTARDLFSNGERAVRKEAWQDAVDDFEALLAAEPTDSNAPAALLDLGLSYQELGKRDKALTSYRDFVRRFPDDPGVRTALVNACDLHAYLEEWPALVETAKALLARTDLDDVDRMTALGARGLGEIEMGSVDAAARDIEDGLDVVEANHYGAENRLPIPAAQLRFALGELRRVRSEQISLNPPGADFLAKMDARCTLLLSAQNAYADAIRSVDPHWAEMSGYRVGDMYRRLHHDLMEIPPSVKAKTEEDRQLHFGMMHLRYRVLLEKAVEMMNRTLALARRTGDTSPWLVRTEEAKGEMERALEEEKAKIASLPFKEEELRKALVILEEKATGRPAAP